MKPIPLIYSLLAFLVLSQSCKKDFLERKTNKALLVPSKLSDFQALLDNNIQTFNISPSLPTVSGDEYTTAESNLVSMETAQRNSYLWLSDNFYGTQINIEDWVRPYKQVFYTNIVLDGLEHYKPKVSELAEWKRIKGIALFNRAFAFHNLAQVFAKQYDPATASKDLGIPIRLTADVNIKSIRGTVEQTYNQIIRDLTEACPLLATVENFKTRPVKRAVYAMLARVYLTMENYPKAGLYADSCLQLGDKLLDYSTISSAGTGRPFPTALPNGNEEIIMYSGMSLITFVISSTLTAVDANLYNSFSANDLRKTLFFRDAGGGRIVFRGTYSGTGDVSPFAGLATDEVYLIRAECLARSGNTLAALTDLNTLLKTRWKPNTFVPFTAATAEDALKLILTERRKQLFARGLRWSDLRRLNRDSRFAITIKRVLSTQTYLLPPNDPRYVFPIPDEEITGSGIEQNER